MAYEMILTETQGKVAVIRLNRPQALNALCDQLMTELGDALRGYDKDPAIAAIVSRVMRSCSAGTAARRAVFTDSGPESASPAARVPGRSRDLHAKIESERTSSRSRSVSPNSASVSPGKPTMMSVDSAMSGRAARMRATRAR